MKLNVLWPDLSTYKDNKVIILRGMSGSGKSTIARQLKTMYGGKIVSRDLIRTELVGEENMDKYFAQKMDYSVEEEVTKREEQELAKAITSGAVTIVDNTNLHMKYVSAAIRVALDCGIQEKDIALIDLPPIPIELAEERIVGRGKCLVSRDVLEKQHLILETSIWSLEDAIEAARKLPPKKWKFPPFPVEKYVPDVRKPKTFLFDIDGTTAMRTLLTEPTLHYRSFYDYASVEHDTYDEGVGTIIQAIQALNDARQEDTIEIIFVSGRKEDSRDVTEQFLNSHNVGPHKLFMRNPEIDHHDGKDDPDDLVKYRLFNENIRDKYNVLGVFDDRKRVVALWETLGLKVFNVGKLNEEF